VDSSSTSALSAPCCNKKDHTGCIIV
jgi:hypothetical protein